VSRALPAIREGGKMLRTLFAATILAGALAGSAMAQAQDAGCALPSEPKGIPAAIDAAISGPADKDRACMKALLIPEARMMFVSFFVRIIVLANSDNVIDSKCHNR
jgi:hypothetical protein